ncbi:MAG: hypothetical protein QIT36_gp035 [Methanophagales virus GBV301]|uniref:Uncharacterized protein n=1 Tax=Methanophagales virus GBV301 TaxID=2999280 RepID=A0A9E9A5X6_9CAUD|nr:MAG: hypothetical protein QIT36_gp035 [Methanophagales virus GBV301]WAE39459.1 MAG: hypothetical protein LDLAKGPJ_00035 [Methanophagales virus GBV301]
MLLMEYEGGMQSEGQELDGNKLNIKTSSRKEDNSCPTFRD